MSLEFVQQALVSEEQKRQVSTSTAEDDQNSALQASKSTAKPFRGRCYTCNKEGYRSYECPEKPVKSSKASDEKYYQKVHRAKTVNEDSKC